MTVIWEWGSDYLGVPWEFPLTVPRHTHIAPLKWWLRDDFPFWEGLFSRAMLVLNGGSPVKF